MWQLHVSHAHKFVIESLSQICDDATVTNLWSRFYHKNFEKHAEGFLVVLGRSACCGNNWWNFVHEQSQLLTTMLHPHQSWTQQQEGPAASTAVWSSKRPKLKPAVFLSHGRESQRSYLGSGVTSWWSLMWCSHHPTSEYHDNWASRCFSNAVCVLPQR